MLQSIFYFESYYCGNATGVGFLFIYLCGVATGTMFNPSFSILCFIPAIVFCLFIFIEVFNYSIPNADGGAQFRGIGVLPSQAREGPHPSELDYLCDCYVLVHASCLISQCNFFNPSVTFQDFIFYIYFLVVTPSK